MSVELRQLRYFVAVAEAGQISAAARGLHLAQPALTHSMQTLERAVGADLLDRHPRGVTLTAAGTRLLAGARASIAACDRALAEARELAPPARAVRVGAVPAAPGLGDMLAGFRSAHPDIRLRWVPLSFDRDGSAITDEEVDVALVLPDYQLTGVLTEALFEMPVYACASIHHPIASRRDVRVEDIAQDTFPGQHPSVPNAFADLFYLTALHGRRPTTSASVPLTPDETWALIASGDAITTTPAGSWLSCPETIAVRRVIDAAPFVFRMMWRADASPAVDSFICHMRARYGSDSAARLLREGGQPHRRGAIPGP